MEKKHEIPDFVCNCCKNNIVSGVIVICAVCENVILCPKCFSKGSQFQDHKANHDYQIFSKKNRLSIYHKQWNIDEEYFLLEGIRLKGLGNWEGISNYLATKSIEQCKKHYQKIYLHSINFPNPNSQPIPSNTERKKSNQPNSQKIQPIEEEQQQQEQEEEKSQSSMSDQKIQQQKKKKKKNSSFDKTNFFKEKKEFNQNICSKKPRKVNSFKKQRKDKEKDIINSSKKVKKLKMHKKKKVKKIKKLRKNKKHQNTNFLKTKNNHQYQKKLKPTEIRSNPKNNPFENYRHKLGKHTFAELSGYMPKRNEFEIEYDNTCEILTSNIGRGDHQIPWTIKNNILRFYNERILERERRKKFVISMGLLQPKSLQKLNNSVQQDDYRNYCMNNDDTVIKDSFQLENIQSTRKRKIGQLQKTNEIGLEIKKKTVNNEKVFSNKKEKEKGKGKGKGKEREKEKEKEKEKENDLEKEKINKMIIENNNENKMFKNINERTEKDKSIKTNGQEKNKYQNNDLIPMQNFPFHSKCYEMELEKKMKIFTRCFKTQSEFQQIKNLLLPEYKLRKEISKLMEWKLKGINTFSKGEEFELEKEKIKQKKLKKKQNKLRKKIQKEKERLEKEKKERQEKKEKERLERERKERERKEIRLQRRETNPYRNRITQLNKIQDQNKKKGKEKEKGKERRKEKGKEKGKEREKELESRNNNDQKRVFKNQKKKKSNSKQLTKKQKSQRKKNKKTFKQKTKPKKKILKFKSKRNKYQNKLTNPNFLENSKLKSNKRNNIIKKIKDNQISRGNNNDDEIEIKSGRILIEEDQTELLPWEKSICQEIDILPHRFLEIKNKLSNQVEFHSDPKKHQENVEIIRQYCRKNSLN
ncbi:transcriptional adapter 2-alpha [Anaeramoeba flamelloides]|uniref:Transcriptional adapter 2-alpha n=1 Tax=Anaeramoeba flamelloides TaxID=1746091 RepID=A0AAV7ZGM7_9EUKA|nr:transcriptional adapter 2-alpha [Anaeramoeba flamelloides]